jgi:hypothetical protein
VTGHGVHGAQRSGPLGAFQPSTGPETHFQNTVLGTRHVINVGPCAEIVHTSGIHTRKEIMVALHYPRDSTCWSRNPFVRLKTKLTRPCSRVDLDCNKPHKVHADYSCSTRLWFLDDFTQEQSHGGATSRGSSWYRYARITRQMCMQLAPRCNVAGRGFALKLKTRNEVDKPENLIRISSHW